MRTNGVYITGTMFLAMFVFAMFLTYRMAQWDDKMYEGAPVTILEKLVNDDESVYFFKAQHKGEQPVTFRVAYNDWQQAKVNDTMYYKTILVKPSLEEENKDRKSSHFAIWACALVLGCFFIGSACVTSDDSD